jgi:hypothetical protein
MVKKCGHEFVWCCWAGAFVLTGRRHDSFLFLANIHSAPCSRLHSLYQALVHNSNAAWAQMNHYHRQRIAGPLPGGSGATPGALTRIWQHTLCFVPQLCFVLVACDLASASLQFTKPAAAPAYLTCLLHNGPAMHAPCP